MREFGLAGEPAELERALAETLPAGAWADPGPFEASEEASWARIIAYDSAVMARLGHAELPPTFFQRIEQTFAERASWHIYPDVLPVLEALTGAGIRTAVISNWLWNAPELLHQLELAHHFEALVISARLGYQKPHPRIFLHALEVMRVAPARAIHVGDSLRSDVEGARAVGIQPVLIARERRPNASLGDGAEVVPVIDDLHGLLALIGIPALAAAAPR
jgi:putative hydrolase of the HAD superfamily